MLINEVCKKCKLTKKAVEYYGEQGLIKPVVMENGYRQFSDDDAMKLKKIAILRGLGLSVTDIRITLEKDDISMLHDVLEKKEYEIKDLQAKQELIRQLSQQRDWNTVGERLEALQQKQSVLNRMLNTFPGCYGKLVCSHFAPFLGEPITTTEQQEAMTEIVDFLDSVNIVIPEDLQEYLDEAVMSTDTAIIQNASDSLASAMENPEQYIKDNKEMLKQYQTVMASEEYKATPMYKLQELIRQLCSENGYNDVFIPAMKRLSPSYREYHRALEAANDVFKNNFQL